MKVELDKKSLFALASDTRLEILKSLQPMRRTVSQLSESLNIDKAAIHRHLKKMEEGGLVTRYEDHGFVYYGLSWKARDLISPNENTRIVVLLSSTLLLAVLVSFFLVVGLSTTGTLPARQLPYGDGEDISERITEAAEEFPMTWLLPLAVVTIFTVIAALAMARTARKPKQRIDPEVEGADVPRPVPED